MTAPPLNYIESYYHIDLTTWEGFWWMASGRAYRFFAFDYPLEQILEEFGTFVGLLNRNFLGVGLLFGVGGIVWLFCNQRDVLIGFGVTFVCTVVFFANYRVLDKDTMFLPAYFVWAVFISAGIQFLREMFGKNKSFRVNTSILDCGISLVLCMILALGIGLNWQWIDMSHMVWPSQFAEEVMAKTEPNSTVIADWSSAVILEYFQLVEGKRSDLKIINISRLRVARYYQLWEEGKQREYIMGVLEQEDLRLVQDELAKSTVYVIEYDPLLSKEYVYLPEGSFFQLASKP